MLHFKRPVKDLQVIMLLLNILNGIAPNARSASFGYEASYQGAFGVLVSTTSLNKLAKALGITDTAVRKYLNLESTIKAKLLDNKSVNISRTDSR